MTLPSVASLTSSIERHRRDLSREAPYLTGVVAGRRVYVCTECVIPVLQLSGAVNLDFLDLLCKTASADMNIFVVGRVLWRDVLFAMIRDRLDALRIALQLLGRVCHWTFSRVKKEVKTIK